MHVNVDWQDGMSFVGTTESGFRVNLDAGKDVGGDDNGFRPMELISIGLASCTAMDVISILKKKRQNVTDFEVHVNSDQAKQHPKVFTQATIDYHVTGQNVDEKAVLRAIGLSAERYCPAQAMLKQVFPMDLRYHIFEENNGAKKLMAEGEYTPVDS